MRAALLCALAVSACAAAPNPRREELAPVSSAPRPAVPPAAPEDPPAAAQAPSAAPLEAAPAAAREVDDLVLGRVGDEPIGAREFLQRLWMRDHSLARTVLEQIVFARTAMLEADRLGVTLGPEEVEAEVARALKALEDKLATSSPGTSVDEYVREKLDLDPVFYRRQIRADAIAQLLAERCVRAWLLESERAVVRLTEIEGEDALARAKAALDAGQTFEEVAQAYGRGEDAETRSTRMVIARAETQELARLAFATPVGSVGGPLVEGGRYLLLVVDERLPAVVAAPSELAAAVARSLSDDPVDNLEYVQWRAAMARRYQVRFEALLEMFEPRR